jgi:hypothetical protein
MKLIQNHEQQDGTKSFDCVVKLFNPYGLGTWYLSELDPDTNIAYGLCSITDAEFGYVSIDEIRTAINIERDKMWTAGTSLQDCLDIERRKQTNEYN